jgi:hypothetical protein
VSTKSSLPSLRWSRQELTSPRMKACTCSPRRSMLAPSACARASLIVESVVLERLKSVTPRSACQLQGEVAALAPPAVVFAASSGAPSAADSVEGLEAPSSARAAMQREVVDMRSPRCWSREPIAQDRPTPGGIVPIRSQMVPNGSSAGRDYTANS